ncbi:hypothetical protein BBJ28_00009250 [Nothophytophthora sp. Chile5]|nr:hypothetical protein BBJ28_00009250 [Nothophytophthora sp. Chile5]
MATSVWLSAVTLSRPSNPHFTVERTALSLIGKADKSASKDAARAALRAAGGREDGGGHGAGDASAAAVPGGAGRVYRAGHRERGQVPGLRRYIARKILDDRGERWQRLPCWVDVDCVAASDVSIADSRAEKTTRSALKAAVEQTLNSKTIVLLDALNYTKGERYELFCKAKAESTTYCVIYLAARFEVPSAKNRWDRPLFRLTPSDFAADGSGAPLDAIVDAIRFGKSMKAGLATQAAPVAESSFLQALDEVTGSIVETLLAHQRDVGVADGLRLAPHTAKGELQLTRVLTMAEARRHRRQFVKISRLRPCAVAAIGDLFVDYLNQQT